jgi:hypothetical protein
VKTLHVYEPGDIDLEAEDPVQSFLFAQVLVIAITGLKKQEGDPDDATWPFRRQVANILNAAQRAGIVIAKGEAVPEAFR